MPCHPLATPMPLTSADAYRMAHGYFEEYLESSRRFYVNAEENIERGWNKEAAFLLHQAAERLYICFLLVRTLYFPRSHNVKLLRSLSEDREQRLIAAWPREAQQDRRRFELLKRAYVEARYSASYEISAEDLTAGQPHERVPALSVASRRDVREAERRYAVPVASVENSHLPF